MPAEVRGRSWWVDGLLVAGFAALTAALAAGWLLDVDVAVRDWCDARRPVAGYWIARTLNFLGNGTPLALIAAGLAVLVAWRTRSARPLLAPIIAFVLTTGIILPLKFWTDRPVPRSTLPDPVELFQALPSGEYGESYPSGHVVVAIVWYGVLLFLLRQLVRVPDRLAVVIRMAPPVIVFLAGTYLSFHWLTDGVAGALLGLFIDRLVARTRPFTHPTRRPVVVAGRHRGLDVINAPVDPRRRRGDPLRRRPG